MYKSITSKVHVERIRNTFIYYVEICCSSSLNSFIFTYIFRQIVVSTIVYENCAQHYYLLWESKETKWKLTEKNKDTFIFQWKSDFWKQWLSPCKKLVQFRDRISDSGRSRRNSDISQRFPSSWWKSIDSLKPLCSSLTFVLQESNVLLLIVKRWIVEIGRQYLLVPKVKMVCHSGHSSY